MYYALLIPTGIHVPILYLLFCNTFLINASLHFDINSLWIVTFHK